MATKAIHLTYVLFLVQTLHHLPASASPTVSDNLQRGMLSGHLMQPLLFGNNCFLEKAAAAAAAGGGAAAAATSSCFSSDSLLTFANGDTKLITHLQPGDQLITSHHATTTSTRMIMMLHQHRSAPSKCPHLSINLAPHISPSHSALSHTHHSVWPQPQSHLAASPPHRPTRRADLRPSQRCACG